MAQNEQSPFRRTIWYGRDGKPLSGGTPAPKATGEPSPYSRRLRRKSPLTTVPGETESQPTESETFVEDEPVTATEPETRTDPEEVEPIRAEELPLPPQSQPDEEAMEIGGKSPDTAAPRSPRVRGIAAFLLLYLLPLLLIAAAGVILFGIRGDRSAPIYDLEAFEARKPYRYIGSFNRDFGDLNALQLKAAASIGIKPAATRSELRSRRGLVSVTESPTLTIDRLTHSQALLVPEAASLLREIGERFSGRLAEDRMPLYSVIVTSVTRSDEDVRSLRKGNGNASDNSTHAYGTTFDISWKRFHKTDPLDPRDIPPEELKHLLAIVLDELHDEGRCYIKHERLQACFHITAIK